MILLFLLMAGALGFPAQENPVSRKVLGSSVVTSVSVIMDAKDTHYSDAVGKPVPKPQSAAQVASPINLLNPDRYEFYTFDDSGDLVKRLMTLEEIQSIIANGDGESVNYNAESYTPEKKVNDVVNNVQNVLKEEIMSHKNTSVAPVLDTPDVSSTWSMILPAIFGNSGEQIKPGKPINSVTADTIVVEDQVPIVQKPMPFTPSKPTTQRITTKPTTQRISTKPTTQKIITKPSISTVHTPLITVAIITNKNKVNTKPTTTKKPVTYKPVIINNQEVLKEVPSKKPSIKPSTYRPSTYKVPSSTKPQPYDDDDDEFPNQHKSTTVRSTTTTTKTTTKLPTTKSTGEPTTTSKRVYFEEFEELAQPIETTTAHTSTAFIKLDTQKPVSQFIQLFEYPTTSKQMIDDDEIPSSKMTEATLKTTRPTSPSPFEYGTTVFLIDHKTNTRIPITTKEQLTTLLNSLPQDSTTELLKSSSSNNFVQTVSKDESEYTYKMTQTTESMPVEKNNAQFEDDEIPSYVKPTTTQESKYPTTEDIDKISVPEILDQLLLTSTNIYEINTELGNKVDGELPQQTTENLVAESTNAFKQTDSVIIQQDDVEKQEESTTQETTTSQKEYTLPLQQVENTTPEKLPETTPQKEIESITKDYETSTVQKFEDATTQTLDNTEATTLMLKQEENVTLQTLQKDKDIAESTSEKNKDTVELTSETNKDDKEESTSQHNKNTEESTSQNNKVTEESTKEMFESTTLQQDITVQNQETTVSSLEKQETTDESTIIQKLETTTLQEQEATTIIEKTEPSIINSIEQLIQQAVGNIAESINNGNDGERIGALMSNMNDKPMSIVQMESATAASNLLDKTIDQETTTEVKENEKTTEFDILSEAMDSILSQVVSSEKQGLTTLDFSTTPEQKTTDVLIETTEGLKDSVAANSKNTDKYEESEIATTTEVKVETTTQPEYYTEKTTQKVISIFDPSEIQSIQDNNEILNTEASSYIDESLTTDKSPIKHEDTTIAAETTPTETNVISTEAENPTTQAITKIEMQETTTVGSYETTTTPLKIVYDEEYTTEPQKSTEFERKTTLIAIITKPAVKYEDGELVTSQSQSTQSTVLKPDVKKDDSPDANKWSLVSTISPISATQHNPPKRSEVDSRPVKLETEQGFGLEDTTSHLEPDIYQFVSLCNELAFGFWNSVNNGMSAARSVFISPFAATSLLAMVFLGARGATSGEMNEILRLDDMVTFNPHLILKNITESIAIDKKSGVATSVILRELYSDRSKGHLLNFYKERAKQFYDGHVEEVSFKEVGDVIRRRTNLIVKRQTWGKIQEFVKDSSITVKPPLAGVSVSIFQTDCSTASTEGRDGELYFVVLPSIRQRRLIPVPAAVWRSGFLAGYEPGLDATAVAIGGKSQTISTIFVIPGQQGISAPGDGLARLERHLIHSAFKDGAWTRLMKSLIPRPGLEVQIPRYSHRSIINASVALQHMGMKDLFDSHKADLRGLNGVANDLYLSDILQINSFATCGEDGIGDTHHSEIYPATANRTYRRSKKFKDVLQPENAFYDSELLEEPRDYQRAFHDPLHDPSLYALPLPLRPRQARLPDAPRLRFDRPFLYFVRHNPTGLILHMGRFNPRLLP